MYRINPNWKENEIKITVAKPISKLYKSYRIWHEYYDLQRKRVLLELASTLDEAMENAQSWMDKNRIVWPIQAPSEPQTAPETA